MTHGNTTKATFKADIKRKQQLFNRFKRRYQIAKNASERQFLKAEAGRIVTDLKQCNKKWKTWGFGACTWIMRNFTVSNFTAGATTIVGKSAWRKSSARRTSRRGVAARSGMTRSRSRNRTRTSAARRSYFVW